MTIFYNLKRSGLEIIDVMEQKCNIFTKNLSSVQNVAFYAECCKKSKTA